CPTSDRHPRQCGGASFSYRSYRSYGTYRTYGSDPVDLPVVEIDLDGPAPDSKHHLHLRGLAVAVGDVLDRALHVREHPLSDLDRVAHVVVELDPALGRVGGLHLLALLARGQLLLVGQHPLDLAVAHRLRQPVRPAPGAADEIPDPGRLAEQVEHVFVELDLAEQVARELLDLLDPPLAVPSLGALLHW